ncbi:MAG TPA: acyl-ACP thioesterase domain-containing protein [Streptosporangiaceae bacterium]|jgi:acyl-ACP thioesterase|nr:acyl-ACP thioesterase domain-containing protein [Streptosporangiaceae bacterium]
MEPARTGDPLAGNLAGTSAEFRPDPELGRLFTGVRIVRGTDASQDGRLRFDALARYLQDVAEDDVADAGWDEPYGWLVRRCAVTIRGYPRVGEEVLLRTFCSGTGPRWAERTTTVCGAAGDVMQATALWAAVCVEDGRPVALGHEFQRLYGPSTRGRTVSARLSHPRPPAGASAGAWPLRSTDFDIAGHVNNSVHWAAAEDVLALAAANWLPSTAEVEYRRPIQREHEPRLVIVEEGCALSAWLIDEAGQFASVRLGR